MGSLLRPAGSLFVVARGSSLWSAGFSLVAVHGFLSSCGMQAPEHVGSLVEAHGLSSCGMQA